MLEEMQEEHGEMIKEQKREARQRVLAAQQNVIHRAAYLGIASDETVRNMLADLYEKYGLRESE
jgi:hypothetical protein